MKKLLSIILTAVMLCSIFALPAAAETETDNRVWFDLDGNSKFFVKKDSNTEYIIGEETYTATNFTDFRTNFKDYLPGVDFAGYLAAPTGDFATDQAAVTSPGYGGSMFLYTTDNNSSGAQYTTPDFTTGEDGYTYWTINDVAYRVNPKKNVIKVIKNAIDTSALEDADKIARYNSINKEAVINVEDGKYKNIGLLAGMTTSITRKMAVTLVYEDTTEEKTIDIATGKADTTTSYLMGIVYLQNFTLTTGGGANSNGGHVFTPFTIETDPTKTLTAIKIKDATTSSNKTCIYVVSAWGEKLGISDFISSIEEIMADGISSLDEYNAVKGYMNSIDAIGDDLTSKQQEIYDSTASAIALYELQLEEIQQEAARQEALAKKTYNYLPLSADRDVFVTWKDFTDLARFQYDATGTTTAVPDGFNTATYDYNGTTIFKWIPHERADGTPVTGKEYYYYKGFKNVALTELSENENERGAAPASATYAYLLDDITGEDGTKAKGRKVAGISSNGDTAKYGSDEYYAGSNGVARATTDTTKTVTNPEFVQALDENGYFIIKKNTGSETHYKIGPVVQDGYSPNAQIIGSSINNVNVKGTTLDLLLTATNINYSSTYYKTASAAINFAPAAALQQITITYEDGETDTKYAVITDNKIASYNGMYAENPVLKTIVFASKYDSQGNEIEYDGNSFYANKANYDFKILKDNTSTVGLTDAVSADDVSFENPHIIMTSNTRVAQMLQLRQDTTGNSYGAFSSAVSLPLANKKVESISFPVTQNIAIDDPSAIVVLDNAKDASKSTVALLPVKIKGASEDYVYFAYLGRISSETYIMAATVTDNSGNEKIQAAQDAMSKITANSTIEEAKKALELYNIALEDINVRETDFDSDIVTVFNSAYKTIRESIELSGKITVNYYKDEKPNADVEIYNLAELEGKPYKVIFAYYDENENYISSEIIDRKTTIAEKETVKITAEKCPENAAKVKGFIWKGLATLTPIAEADETAKKDIFKVLSIGNSYSQNAHSHLVKIAADAGFEKVQIANLFIGGCRIETHYNNAVANNPEYTYQYQELNADGTVKSVNTSGTTMLDGIKAEDWDIITIQQQSLDSGVETTYVKEQIDYLVDYINTHKTNKNAKVVWHMTWPYTTDYTGNTLYGTYFDYKQDAMYNGITDAVKKHIAPRNDFDYIIPAGTAIQNARLLELDDKELSSDGTHLNTIGCYVAGLTWFTKITGMSIDNITYAPAAVGDNLETIKAAVKNAITNPYQVTK